MDSVSISLNWSAPFSLNVTNVEPDIWYSVLITNVTDEDSPTAVSCTDCFNLTQPHYTFSPSSLTQSDDAMSTCFNYSFTVIPQNGVGNGNRSEPVYGGLMG